MLTALVTISLLKHFRRRAARIDWSCPTQDGLIADYLERLRTPELPRFTVLKGGKR